MKNNGIIKYKDYEIEYTLSGYKEEYQEWCNVDYNVSYIYINECDGVKKRETKKIFRLEINWQGCSHLSMDDIGKLHLCGREGYKEFFDLLNCIYKEAFILMNREDEYYLS